MQSSTRAINPEATMTLVRISINALKVLQDPKGGHSLSKIGGCANH